MAYTLNEYLLSGCMTSFKLHATLWEVSLSSFYFIFTFLSLICMFGFIILFLLS